MSAHPAPGRPGYQRPAEATGRPLGEIIYVAALAVTAGADVTAFDQILSLVLHQLGSALIALAVAGFTAMSLTLAHFAGRMRRDAAAGYGPDNKQAVRLLLSAWALLGLAAFAARLIVARSEQGAATQVGGISPASQVLAGAFLFLILYLASGAVAGFGEYLTRNPCRAQYRTALRAYVRAQRRLRRSKPPYERALSVWRQHEEEREQQQQRYEAAVDLYRANARDLRAYAAHLVAAHLQDPSATDGMTLPEQAGPAAPSHDEH